MGKIIVKLDHVSKIFDGNRAVINDLSMEVKEGEFLTLLGPSGCGKTTILRMISGLEMVSSGKVYIDSKDVTDMEAAKRQVNTIFQNLAVFPHMTVFDNVAFGLKMKKVPKDEITKQVLKTLKLVDLEGFEDRKPAQLSGGQLQRVAIARGIITNPKVLLLDESLCSLDLKLKRAMQIELKKIQKKSGITFIYVTHDQDEALTMSDRIIIIDKGIIQQDDTPEEIYQHPKTVFVADFIGESNIISGEIIKIKNSDVEVKIVDNISFFVKGNAEDKTGDKVKIMIRPENVNVSKNKIKDGIKGRIKEIIYDGAVTKLFVDTVGDLSLKVNVHGVVSYKPEDIVYVRVDAEDIVLIRRKNDEGK